jgi:hypothetical protein
MPDTTQGWRSYTTANPPANAAEIKRSPPQEPVATITIVIYNTEPGGTTVSVSAADNGVFSATKDPNTARRGPAYRRLFAVAVRELRDAINLLAD